jgi:predicted Zn-dependent protease
VPGQLLLDDLIAFEANPDLGGDDVDLRANWLASHAYTWAKLRNVRRAKELLQQSHAMSPRSAWIYSIEADVLGFADDWHASLRSAERAWELDRHSLWAATSLATALMNVGEIQEAAHRLAITTSDTQSAQLMQVACWYQCAVTELLEDGERKQSLAKARELAVRLNRSHRWLTGISGRRWRERGWTLQSSVEITVRWRGGQKSFGLRFTVRYWPI